MVKILVALVAALSILNSGGANPGATENVAALVTALCKCLCCDESEISSRNFRNFF